MKTTGIIIAREFIERIKQRSFAITTALGVLFIIGLSFMPSIFGAVARSTATTIAVAAPDDGARAAIAQALSKRNYNLRFVGRQNRGTALPAPLRKSLQSGAYDAALVAERTRAGLLAFTYYPKKSSALEEQGALKNALLKAVLVAQTGGPAAAQMRAALDFRFSVVNLNERYKSDVDELMAKALVYFLLIVLYIAVLMYGIYVGQGVIEEKSNRVMEIMIGAVRPAQLLAGKILGIGAVALVQLSINMLAAAAMLLFQAAHALHAVHGPAAASLGSAPPVIAVPPSILVYLLTFFLLGFFTYATMFAGIGSLLSKPEEVQQYSSVFMMPIVAAYILAIYALENPDLRLIVWTSMVPVMSPMLMFARIATSSVPAWQVAVSIAASLLCIWAFTLAAGKLYRVGVLMYGKPPRPADIWRALLAHT
jgi:ABC-2 type transport system permease protein